MLICFYDRQIKTHRRSISIVLVSACGPGNDSSPTGECGFPAPIVAGTEATNAFSDAPAQCGMTNYAWLRDPGPGEVIERHELIEFTPDDLALALQLLECDGASHQQASSWGMGEILNFIDDRLAEVPVSASNLCQPNPATVCSGTP